MISRLASLLQDNAGSMAIETAIVAPVLAILALGGFEASRIVARQTELQMAAGQAAEIARAAKPDTAAKRATVKGVVEASADLTASHVTLEPIYRCGTTDAYVTDQTSCAPGDAVSSYIRLTLTDSYTPGWVEYGVGGPIDYSVTRTVFLS
jgi:Flp pilus assembly protein TadG